MNKKTIIERIGDFTTDLFRKKKVLELFKKYNNEESGVYIYMDIIYYVNIIDNHVKRIGEV